MRRRKNARPVNGILLLDKPSGVSSNHVLQTVKRLFNAKKAGHTGTLDPLATGMLPICLGEATKISQYLLNSQKAYRAEARLGEITDTGDSEGQIIESCAVDSAVIKNLPVCCGQLIGPGSQVPPMYSALKIDGQRLYKLAREGKSVEREPRSIIIHALDLIAADASGFTIESVCSSGTYIRTLVEDLARAAGSCAHMTALQRMWVSPFESARMHPLETIMSLSPVNRSPATSEGGESPDMSSVEPVAGAFQSLDALLLPMESALSQFASIELNEQQAARFRQGQFLDETEVSPVDAGANPIKVILHMELIGLAEYRERRFKPVKVFNLQ